MEHGWTGWSSSSALYAERADASMTTCADCGVTVQCPSSSTICLTWQDFWYRRYGQTVFSRRPADCSRARLRLALARFTASSI